LAAHAEFIPGHPELSRRISQLHASLAHDDHAQSEIDAHLLAAAAVERGIDLGFPLATLVLDPGAAPQFATLPDLGPVLRDCLVFKRWGSSYLAHCLYCCLPIPKSAAKSPEPDARSCAVLFNVLLATLLGLYPACVKKPPFAVRSRLFARVHALLTANAQTQYAFAVKFKLLLVFSLSEYACRLIPQLFPAEFDSICAAQSVGAFFAQAPAVYESFRQDCVDSGEESWAALSAAAQEAHDRVSKTYRSKCRLTQHHKKIQPAEVSRATLSAAMSCPKIVTYPCHRGSHQTLREEYAALLGSPEFGDVAVLHSLVRIEALPESVRRSQVRACRTACWSKRPSHPSSA